MSTTFAAETAFVAAAGAAAPIVSSIGLEASNTGRYILFTGDIGRHAGRRRAAFPGA